MDELKALISLISKNKVKQIDVIGNPNNHSNQVQQLYDFIADGEIINDEGIINHFFHDSEHAKLYTGRLKRKLKDRLLNTLFFIDINQPDFNDYNRAYYTAYKQAAAVKILLANFARKAAIPLAEKVLKNAIQFELTDIVFTLAQTLSRHYATIEGDLKKFEYYDELTQKYLETLHAENVASSYYNRLRVSFTKTKGFDPKKAVELAKEYTENLKKLIENTSVSSYTLNYISYLVYSIRYEIVNEYDNLLEVCVDALDYFEQKKEMVPENVVFSFTLRKFICLTQLERFSEAWELIPTCLKLAKEGANNWFLALEHFLILSFRMEKYQDAYEFYIKAINNTEYAKLQHNLRERWHIYEAYIYYFIAIKKIVPDDRNPVKKFRLGKFINEVPMYAKDKRGINISIIILQILFLLRQQKYNDIIDKMESLKTYTYRYLRRDDTFRSHCFIRMLLFLPEYSFHKKAVLRRSEDLWKKLQSKPIKVANQIAEVEPVPYEALWTFVLQELDNDWH